MLKNGRACVIRRVEECDAEQMVQYLKQTCGETPYLIRGPEEVRLTTEEEAAMLREGNRDPSALQLLAELDVVSANAPAIALYRKTGL